MKRMGESFSDWLRRIQQEVAREDGTPDPYAEARIEEHSARAYSFTTRFDVERLLIDLRKSW